MNHQNSSKIRLTAAALAVASALVVAPEPAGAASLGKIRVISGLGQPLRAELELSATREEMNAMTVRLAPPDAFSQAGIEYQSLLNDLRFTVDKRSDGKQVVKVSSSKPINEPFLDFLVELNWPSGRLVREYTFLLDPPEVAVRAAARPVAVVDAKVVERVPGGGAEPVAAASPATPEKAPSVKAAAGAPEKKRAEAEPEKKTDANGVKSVTTRSGDTLRKIAGAHKPEGVSLEQMLIGLYRANQDAFFDGNINRLKKGAILSIPDKEAIAAIPQAEAHAEFVAQARDWNSYRQKLAAGVTSSAVSDAQSAQTAGGKITPKVEDKAAPAQVPKDQVKVSRSELNPKTGRGLSDEDRVAMDKALKEAQDRLVSLEKNVTDMQKLLEMKNQKLADLEKQLAAKPAETPAPAPEPKVVPEAKPVEPPVKPEPSVKAPEAPAVEPAKPVPPPPKKVEPPPPAPEPSLVDTLLEDPVPLAGAGGILALLAGFFLMRRRKQADHAENTNTTLAAPATGIGSYHGTGGQSIDTSQTPPQSSEFSQAGPGTIDTDEVDPVAEAEVYMAYGRDAQAEEILLEALQKDGQRTAVHVKLLEIYANRKSLKQFETLAEELYAQTAGHGSDWAKAAALGVRLDPSNPLYRNNATTLAAAPAVAEVPVIPEEPAEFDPEATMVVAPPNAQEDLKAEDDLAIEAAPVAEETLAAEPLPTLDFDAGVAETAVPVTAEPPAPAEDDALGLDFDLSPVAESPASPVPEVVEAKVEDDSASALDFDLGSSLSVVPPTPEEAKLAPVADEMAVSLDFDLDQPASIEPVAEAPVVPEPAVPAADALLEMPSLDLPESVMAEEVSLSEPVADIESLEKPADTPKFDLSSINLDLTVPSEDLPAADSPSLEVVPEVEAVEPVAEAAPAEPAGGNDAAREEVSTKLDLAKAYEEMGDLEGARELLSEVVAEGPPDLSAEAKAILERIGH